MHICIFVAGCIHAGFGLEQLNNLLTTVNISPVSNSLWTRKQQEISEPLAQVVEESVTSALFAEQNATIAAGEGDSICVSVDGAWQSRGSGRSYNSASGHASAIGKHTGKIVGYAVRAKVCRVCRTSKRNDKPPPVHDCVHNWDGSSKAMEADMVTQILKDSKSHGVRINQIIGDEDSTTIARARREVNYELTKGSDMNHLKKILGNKLHELKRRHKALTPKVISHFQTMYTVALHQNVGNAEATTANLWAIVPHSFGDHS